MALMGYGTGQVAGLGYGTGQMQPGDLGYVPAVPNSVAVSCPACQTSDVSMSYLNLILLLIFAMVCGLILGMGIWWLRVWFAENYTHKPDTINKQ